MARVAVVQMEAASCRPPRLPRVDLAVYPVSLCPVDCEAHACIAARGSYFEVVEDGWVYAAPCGSVVVAAGLRLLLLCSVDPCIRCGGVDAVVAAEPRWAGLGEAQREARRLTYLLMTLSYRCDAPVVYVNLWGRVGSRVYTGRSGFYDYRVGIPLALGGWGDGVLTREL